MNANNEHTANTAASLFGRYILKSLADWWQRQRAMDELMALDEHTLKDIGVARCEIAGIVAGNVVPRRAANANPMPAPRAVGQD